MTKIVHIRRFPVKGGFYAINLFGIIFTIQELSAVELNHERIHTAQQRELFFVGFYLWYVVEWLFLLVKFRNGIKAYFNIRFEKEAYNHQSDLNYLKHRHRYHYR
ncbi:MAG: hypothetical protein SO442_07845 [Prevotella sp.]|uniref:Uncharacterized protein n=1 Tax=Hallella mizrahii TaxID=2606637 RepID=A0A7K0KH06_9BACT|nr:hypothetical protein [Hallella mizrahii]MDD7336506.1 hypothetical protein [Prevotella sp.]MDY4626503.1 hypothetical protein [Prevotella sp.]MST84730.1 hypothetical protein [Hallella mizrahii]